MNENNHLDQSGTIRISFKEESPKLDSLERKELKNKVDNHLDYFVSRIRNLKKKKKIMDQVLRIRNLQIFDLIEQLESGIPKVPISLTRRNGIERKEFDDERYEIIKNEKRYLEERVKRLEKIVKTIEDENLGMLGYSQDMEEEEYSFLNDERRRKEVMESIVNFTESKTGCGFFESFCC